MTCADPTRYAQVRPRIIHCQLCRYSFVLGLIFFLDADAFSGLTRIGRLHHIGSHSPYLALDAYRLAIVEAKKGKNVNLYLQLVEEMTGIAPQDPAALTDTAWAEKKAQETQREQDRLEHELKSYKNNLIKESIRVCLDRLLSICVGAG
jgi:hypothetical protein